ncbi:MULTISPECIES: methyltransferase type 11 [unclassified Brevundimonas]|uniref:methyltransferase type 11 n=1 Tax=unclassified Brevundimonas TaxID=2622653 RepID=UPI003F930803
MHQILWPICALALMTAACDNGGSVRITTTSSGNEPRGVLKVVDTLQCPQNQGVLTRKGSARADGATCIYSGPRGAEVTLHLVPLNGASVHDTLKAFENRLAAALPEAMAEVRGSEDSARADAADADADAAKAEGDAQRPEVAAAQAEAMADAAGDSAHVSAPGLRVDAQGDKASVRLPGMRIDADGDRANIKIGGITIRADDRNSQVNLASDKATVSIDARNGGARIRTSAPGEAVRATFRMTADQSSTTGWRIVGYEARGPSGGPIIVATVRGKDRNENRVFDAARALVTLNVGD